MLTFSSRMAVHMLRPVMWDYSEHTFSFIWQSVTFAAEIEGLYNCVALRMALYPSAFTKLYIFGFNTRQEFISISGNEKMTKFSTWLVTIVELGDEAIELRK
jgi:hypothetical protein